MATFNGTLHYLPNRRIESLPVCGEWWAQLSEASAGWGGRVQSVDGSTIPPGQAFLHLEGAKAPVEIIVAQGGPGLCPFCGATFPPDFKE